MGVTNTFQALEAKGVRKNRRWKLYRVKVQKRQKRNKEIIAVLKSRVLM